MEPGLIIRSFCFRRKEPESFAKETAKSLTEVQNHEMMPTSACEITPFRVLAEWQKSRMFVSDDTGATKYVQSTADGSLHHSGTILFCPF
jgi:hypothetical protein